EIASYQEVSLCLEDQKIALIEWNIKKFQKVSQQIALLISRAHKSTNVRQDLMESIFILKNKTIDQNSLKTICEVIDEEELKEQAVLFFKTFSNTLKKINKLSADNKELIKTGLELVGDNLEMIADMIDKDRVYSRVGMIPAKHNSILLNKQV
ncbi:MAG TPA: flagellar export chaperone FlgN, partial [Candidatus Cloacimonadota bacterium]|nr:flagellar export chaperone FlgN [Candidatus Cloacimonadota bacterium]